MRTTFFMIYLIVFFLPETSGQETITTMTDSIYFLNVQKTYKLNILKFYKNDVTTPSINMDFPFSNYHSDSKTLMLISSDDDYTIEESTNAILRISARVDDSYGSGGSDKLVQIGQTNQSIIIDSLVSVDSLSSNGIFILTIKNQKVQLNNNKSYSFDIHRKEKTKEALLDFVTEYLIENLGYISKKIGHEIY